MIGDSGVPGLSTRSSTSCLDRESQSSALCLLVACSVFQKTAQQEQILQHSRGFLDSLVGKLYCAGRSTGAMLSLHGSLGRCAATLLSRGRVSAQYEHSKVSLGRAHGLSLHTLEIMANIGEFEDYQLDELEEVLAQQGELETVSVVVSSEDDMKLARRMLAAASSKSVLLEVRLVGCRDLPTAKRPGINGVGGVVLKEILQLLPALRRLQLVNFDVSREAAGSIAEGL